MSCLSEHTPKQWRTVGQRMGGGGAPSRKVCVVTSVASFWYGGGGQDPNVPIKNDIYCASERAPQKHIFSGLEIHLPRYTINAFSFTYGYGLLNTIAYK